MIKYVEQTQNLFLAPCLKVEYQVSGNSAMIDIDTANHIELLQSSLHPKSHNSLFGFLNRCCTTSGMRRLRSYLFQPPIQKEKIEARLDAVGELLNDPAVFHSLQALLSRFPDVDYLLSLCAIVPKNDGLHNFEHRLNNIISLKQTLELLEPLTACLEGAESSFLSETRNVLIHESCNILEEKVAKVIHENAKVQRGSAAMKLQRCFAIKSELDGLLDVARKAYCEIVDDIEAMVAGLSEEYGLPLKLNFNATRGYHVQISDVGKQKGRPGISIKDLPKTFINCSQQKNTISFTTDQIVLADQRSKEVLGEVMVMSNDLVMKLLEEIRAHLGFLYKVSERISELDVIVSFARVVQESTQEFVRPQFGNALIVEEGRHPILEHMMNSKKDVCPSGEVIPNNIIATEESSFHILTGANMSGKSTYLKQVALMQVRYFSP